MACIAIDPNQRTLGPPHATVQQLPGRVAVKLADVMTRGFAALAVILSASLAAPSQSSAADVEGGARIARQWCANCHVIGDAPGGTVQQGPPSFRAIAQGGLTPGQLQAFLSHPHGAMPDLALTRAEIDDVIVYIETLR